MPVIPVHRPPGALPEREFMQTCTRCNECLPACPHNAITLAPARLRGVAGTPVIQALEQPCWMCADTPCIAACKPGALVRGGEGFPRMGTALIQVMDCLAHQGGTCSSCWERCPAPGAIAVEDGRPRIVADLCTGCGVCQHVCPAPHNAVILLPAMKDSGAGMPPVRGDGNALRT